ncbi:hybrid sensor histidine kinase/response regulator [Actinospongicola halichondriae]|uniref:hybrid sensor histidine kinase/response regulator n=1 Tax=Actinospongicola halichondriae TaxID=3236844 RepID=UPI003D3D314A
MSSRQTHPIRPLWRAVLAPLAVVIIGVVATFSTSSRIQNADEDALAADLDADAAQLGLLLQSMANGIETDLTSTVGIALVTGGDEDIYRTRADDGSGGDRALLRLAPDPKVLVAIAGDGDDTAVARAFERIAENPSVNAQLTSIAEGGDFGLVRLDDDADGTRRLVIAAGATDGETSLVEMRSFDLGPAGPAIVDILDGIEHFAVYVSEQPDPASAVIASTDDLPLTGKIATTTTDLGGRTLLIEVRGATQQVFASWVVIGAGSALSMLLGGLLLVSQRRRDAAIASLEAARSSEHARMSMESELQRAQRMEAVGQLAGGIAHDFNNLLAAISSTVELVAEDVHDERTRDDLDEIRHAARRGAALTRRLLTFSRRDVEAHELLDLNAVVDDVRTLLSRSITADMTLRIRTHDQPIPVMGDAGELEQVLLNLVVNARDAASGPDHVIEISTATDGDTAVLAVRDNGMGMRQDVIDHAVEPFFSTKSKTDGTGLGLAIVYGIANRMDGSVDIASAIGEGTTISVRLPVSNEPLEPAFSPDDASTIAAPDGHRQVVLLVEDEPTVRRATRRLLERAGHHVLDVADGAQAITALEDGFDPTVVLTDLVLPGSFNGRDVANCVRQMTPTARIVFASGYPSEIISRRDLLEEGATFLAKPFSSEALLVAVDGASRMEPAR